MSDERKHSELPWVVDDLGMEYFDETNHRWAIGTEAGLIRRIAKVEGYGEEYKANADLIVRAVNSHYDLLESCRAAYRDLACVQLCLLQNDTRGALEILRKYGPIELTDGPRFRCPALAEATQ